MARLVASSFCAETVIVDPSTVLSTDVEVALPLTRLVPLNSAVATIVEICSRRAVKSLCSAVLDARG